MNKKTIKINTMEKFVFLFLVIMSVLIFSARTFYVINFRIIDFSIHLFTEWNGSAFWFYLFIIGILFIISHLALMIFYGTRFARHREQYIYLMIAGWSILNILMTIFRLNEPFLLPIT